jgi:hypothetical protein
VAAIALPRQLRDLRLEGSWPWVALALDVALRLAILVFAADSWLDPDDGRYEGKNLGGRNVFILVFTLLLPFYHLARREWSRYPVWWHVLYLSVFAFDMGGNFFGLYDGTSGFDHLAHFHGPGALAVVLAAAFGFGAIAAAGLTTMLHTALEVQEFYADVYAGTRNVRGLFDSMNDLTAGLLGVGIYLVLYYRLRGRARRPPRGAAAAQAELAAWEHQRDERATIRPHGADGRAAGSAAGRAARAVELAGQRHRDPPRARRRRAHGRRRGALAGPPAARHGGRVAIPVGHGGAEHIVHAAAAAELHRDAQPHADTDRLADARPHAHAARDADADPASTRPDPGADTNAGPDEDVAATATARPRT